MPPARLTLRSLDVSLAPHLSEPRGKLGDGQRSTKPAGRAAELALVVDGEFSQRAFMSAHHISIGLDSWLYVGR